MDRSTIFVAVTVAMDALGAGLLLSNGWKLGSWIQVAQTVLAVALLALAVALLLRAGWARVGHLIAAALFFGALSGLASASPLWVAIAAAWSLVLVALMLSKAMRAWPSEGRPAPSP